MPTPNQTTPDSPERVRGETPETDAFDKSQGIFYKYGAAIGFARYLEKKLIAGRAETTRLAEALKEAETKGYKARLDEEMTELPEPNNPTLWRYLQNAHEKQITFHTIGVNRMADGGFHFYIHPQSVSGETEDYLLWPDPFNWSDMLVNKKDSTPPDFEKFKAYLAKNLTQPAPISGAKKE